MRQRVMIAMAPVQPIVLIAIISQLLYNDSSADFEFDARIKERHGHHHDYP